MSAKCTNWRSTNTERKGPPKINWSTKEGSFKKISRPTELDQQIVADEDVTSVGKSKKHSSKKHIDEGDFIPDQQVVHLDTLASRRKRRIQDVESNVSTET